MSTDEERSIIKRSEPQLDQSEFSLVSEITNLENLVNILNKQGQELDPYFRQQILMRKMLKHDVSSLSDRLAFIERFNDLLSSGRPSIVVAHHGTTWSRAKEIKRQIDFNVSSPFRRSMNDWEWLGHGVYFWIMAPHRGLNGEENSMNFNADKTLGCQTS